MSRSLHHLAVGLCALLLLLSALTTSASAQQIKLERPGDREFIRDLANLVDPAAEQQIVATCDKLLTEHATPIIVVTIENMAAHGTHGIRIETFATLLFDQWRIGHAELNKQAWNTGILLLVSKGDRKARIELGAGWGHEKDALCARIMGDQIVPAFKKGDYAAGITAGVRALDAMARGKPLPTRKRPWQHYALVVAFIGLLIFTVVSLVRRGSSGWAWVFWAAVFAVLGVILIRALKSRGGGGGGGFSGGSFGGGSSGGGGATGSW